jgi:hypothetical protein
VNRSERDFDGTCSEEVLTSGPACVNVSSYLVPSLLIVPVECIRGLTRPRRPFAAQGGSATAPILSRDYQ